MTDSPTGIIPEYLMFREKRKDVRAWLISQPFPAHMKRDLLFAWARTVVIRLSASEVSEVENSGHVGGSEVV
jgi:hypothetical protein